VTVREHLTWESLVAAALLGTDRRAPEPVVPPGAPAELGAALARRSAEEALLGAAAAWAVARRAGALAGAAKPPAPAPEDPRPVCSPAAGRRLAALLAGEHRALLPEWLATAEAAGLRPVPELLPALLESAVVRTELRPAVAAAAGPRGAWLAERQPRWAFPPPDPERWATTDSRGERRALLAELRRRDPARARELLVSTWDEESPEDRATFVAVLAEGLSPDDEPFLESVLDDRRKPVRHAAAELLWALPASRLAARMAVRARPLITRTRRRLRATLPDRFDEGMARDGIDLDPPRGTGERQFWLAQLIAATPLATWPETLGAPPDELARLPFADDLGPLAHDAWTQAAIRQRDAEWARALWAARPEPALLTVLPREEREALAARGSLDDALACPGPWGPELSRAVLERFRATVQERWPGVDVDEVGTRLHPDTLAEVEALREIAAGGWAATLVARLADLAAFRAGMLRELR
jgi:Family of unknown function (DUF5691)